MYPGAHERPGVGIHSCFPDVPHRLKDKTEVVLVEEISVEADDVELVIGVSLVQFLKHLQFLETGLMPAGRGRETEGIREKRHQS